MKRLLPLPPHQSHYLGKEKGSVHKKTKDVMIHCVLTFPALYEIGMSYLE